MVLKLTEKQQRIIAGLVAIPLLACLANWTFDWGWFGGNGKGATALSVIITATVMFRLGPPDGAEKLFDIGEALRELALVLVPITTIIVSTKLLQAKYPTVEIGLLFGASGAPVMALTYGYVYWWRKRRESKPDGEADNGKN